MKMMAIEEACRIFRILEQIFILDAINSGLNVHDYSGNLMYTFGCRVAAVTVDNVHDLKTGIVICIIKDNGKIVVHTGLLALVELKASECQGLTDNQMLFIDDAEKMGLTVVYDYSGKFMNGRRCPAVIVDSYHQLETDAVVCMDNMGARFVVYAMI